MIERTLTVDGAGGPVELSILEAGEGGRPFLLAHGFTGAKEDFADFVDRLADLGWHVVVPDHRGHGASAKPDDVAAYSFDIIATDVLALLDALGWSSTVLLGHSMGGMVSQLIIGRAPERVQALVLMDTSHGSPKGLGDVEGARKAGAVAIAKGMQWLLDAQRSRQSPLETEAHRRALERRPELAAFGERKLLAASPHMYSAMLEEIVAGGPDADRLDDLRKVDVPTLVLVGEEDTPFLKASERMADAIPGAELVVLAGGGHSPQIEAPDAWWTALTTWLAKLPA